MTAGGGPKGPPPAVVSATDLLGDRVADRVVAEYVAVDLHDADRVRTVLQTGGAEGLLSGDAGSVVEVPPPYQLAVDVDVGLALVRPERGDPLHPGAGEAEAHRRAVGLGGMDVVAIVTAEPEVQRRVADRQLAQVRLADRHDTSVERVVGALDQLLAGPRDPGQLARVTPELDADVGRRALVEGRRGRVQQALLPDVQLVQQHELTRLLHPTDGVGAVRQVRDAVDDLLGLVVSLRWIQVRAHRLLQLAVDVDVDVTLARVGLRHVVDAGSDEAVREGVSVGLRPLHVVLVVTQATTGAVVPRTGVDDLRVVVVDLHDPGADIG